MGPYLSIIVAFLVLLSGCAELLDVGRRLDRLETIATYHDDRIAELDRRVSTIKEETRSEIEASRKRPELPISPWGARRGWIRSSSAFGTISS